MAHALLKRHEMQLDERPFIAFWEMTQACDLVCVHCRASARSHRDAQELTTDEGRSLLNQLAHGRVPLVVLTGGDPAKRPDLLELIAHGAALGLEMALTPSATPAFTDDLVRGARDAGMKRMAVSIDGPDARVHDTFRGVNGSFAEAMRMLQTARALGVPTQINTTIHDGSLPHVARMAELVAELGSVLWSVFFVVPTGRAQADMLHGAELTEACLLELAEIAEHAPYVIKTTAAPHYRRVLLQRRREGVGHVDPAPRGREAQRVNDGRGMLFVSHRGEIFPSGFLPVQCGSVRDIDPLEVYRYHPTFRALRDVEALKGKCGACSYKAVCGGSRARAYALTGSLFASDPLCAYVPPGYPLEPARQEPRRLNLVAS